MDREQVELFRDQLRRACVTLGMGKWERIVLSSNPGEGAMVLFHRCQGTSDTADTECQDAPMPADSPLRPRAACSFGSERRIGTLAGVGWRREDGL